jgi:hypothetical protein
MGAVIVADHYIIPGLGLQQYYAEQKKINFNLAAAATWFMMLALALFINFYFHVELYFLPATDVNNVPALVNILMGWKLDFVVLLDDDPDGNKVYRELRRNHFGNNEEAASNKLLIMKSIGSIEDVFSTIDFKNFVLHKRVGITESNSEHIEMNELSRAKLAADFILDVQNNQLTINDFDEETVSRINMIIKLVDRVLS